MISLSLNFLHPIPNNLGLDLNRTGPGLAGLDLTGPSLALVWPGWTQFGQTGPSLTGPCWPGLVGPGRAGLELVAPGRAGPGLAGLSWTYLGCVRPGLAVLDLVWPG